MELFDLIAILLSLTAVLGYLNERFQRLPTTIGVMLFALGFSVLLLLLGLAFPPITEQARELVGSIDFSEALLGIMLSYLLFAGSLHVNLDDLLRQKRVVGLMATFGVIVSTLVVGGGLFGLARIFGFELRFIDCLLFGALISPTDPVAVLGILKVAGAPSSLKTKMTGESLFNDGIGVVLFLVLVGIAVPHHGGESHPSVPALIVLEILGGIGLGAALGLAGFAMLSRIDSYQVEVLITLAIATGGYALAQHLHMSGPLAMVVAGLLIGNHGRTLAMSEKTRKNLDTFWELIDEILNALLFVLIGLEVLVIHLGGKAAAVGFLTIPLVLLARLLAVSVPVLSLRNRRTFSRGAIPILTWGGLRGGISIALALSLPHSLGVARELILSVTYVVVIFSIAVQGLTLKSVIQRCHSPES